MTATAGTGTTDGEADSEADAAVDATTATRTVTWLGIVPTATGGEGAGAAADGTPSATTATARVTLLATVRRATGVAGTDCTTYCQTDTSSLSSLITNPTLQIQHTVSKSPHMNTQHNPQQSSPAGALLTWLEETSHLLRI